jgi:type I restriction enzyme S subunit
VSAAPLIPIRDLVLEVATWNPLKPGTADETFNYVDLSAVDQDLKTITGARAVHCADAPSRARQIVRVGDVLVSTVRPNLNGVALVPTELDGATASTGFCVIRPNPKLLDSSFVFHWVKSPSFVSSMVNQATGASYPAVSDRIVLDSRISLPPLPEQRRIAAILDKADALHTKRREALAQLDRLAQSIFVEMFGDLFTNSKGFAVSRLGDVCDVRDGTHDSPDYVAQGYPLVTSKNVREGKIDLSEVNFISEADYNEINRRSKVDIGDILMPMIGTIGNPVLVENEPSFAIKNMALIKFKLNSPCREFVLQFLRSDCFDRLVASKNKGGTQKFLALGEIRGLPLPVPSEFTQVEFSKRIHVINRKRTRYQDALDGIDGLFASLQHRAFRGEL